MWFPEPVVQALLAPGPQENRPLDAVVQVLLRPGSEERREPPRGFRIRWCKHCWALGRREIPERQPPQGQWFLEPVVQALLAPGPQGCPKAVVQALLPRQPTKRKREWLRAGPVVQALLVPSLEVSRAPRALPRGVRGGSVVQALLALPKRLKNAAKSPPTQPPTQPKMTQKCPKNRGKCCPIFRETPGGQAAKMRVK